jgi:hypothetical protein
VAGHLAEVAFLPADRRADVPAQPPAGHVYAHDAAHRVFHGRGHLQGYFFPDHPPFGELAKACNRAAADRTPMAWIRSSVSMKSRKSIEITAIIVLSVWVVSCSPRIGVQRLDSIERAPNSGSINVYQSAEEVGRPHKRIAVLSVTNQRRVRADRGDFTESLFDKAGQLGADGVIIVEQRWTTQRNSDGMGGYFDFQVLHIVAEAIVYE